MRSRSDDFFGSKKTLHLPVELRDELKVPLGEVVGEELLSTVLKDALKIVTVGDICSLTVFEAGMVPDVAVVDFKTRRGEVEDKRPKILKIGQTVINVKSPAGELTRELWDAVSDAYGASVPVRIEVSGEEDLAALPCIWLAPPGTAVIYGLPGVGLVVVHNESAKIKVENVLSNMK
jgi:uncharacterized protein (UPF0218 family)